MYYLFFRYQVNKGILFFFNQEYELLLFPITLIVYCATRKK